jgi:hypothetical protein
MPEEAGTMTTPEKDKVPSKAAPSAEEKATRRKRLYVIGSVVAALLVSTVAGGLTWHNQPSFCGTVCHSPMASYSASITNPNQLVGKHAKAAKLACLDCHESTVSEQLTEAGRTITGNYVVQSGHLVPTKAVSFDDSYCLGCHASKHTSRKELIEKTAKKYGAYNPHAEPHYRVPCITCHQMHGTSRNYCANCHFKAAVPTGWRARDMQPYSNQPLVPRPAPTAVFQ